jgi:hypothetical protein
MGAKRSGLDICKAALLATAQAGFVQANVTPFLSLHIVED